MGMFAFLGTPEIVVILVIALLIFGPQKLPEIGRQIGSAMRELRKMSSDVQRALDFDDHGHYDRYEPPSYSYTPPPASSIAPLDQYGLEETPSQAALPAYESVAPTEEVTVADVPAPASEPKKRSRKKKTVATDEAGGETAASSEIVGATSPAEAPAKMPLQGTEE